MKISDAALHGRQRPSGANRGFASPVRRNHRTTMFAARARLATDGAPGLVRIAPSFVAARTPEGRRAVWRRARLEFGDPWAAFRSRRRALGPWPLLELSGARPAATPATTALCAQRTRRLHREAGRRRVAARWRKSPPWAPPSGPGRAPRVRRPRTPDRHTSRPSAVKAMGFIPGAMSLLGHRTVRRHPAHESTGGSRSSRSNRRDRTATSSGPADRSRPRDRGLDDVPGPRIRAPRAPRQTAGDDEPRALVDREAVRPVDGRPPRTSNLHSRTPQRVWPRRPAPRPRTAGNATAMRKQLVTSPWLASSSRPSRRLSPNAPLEAPGTAAKEAKTGPQGRSHQ